MSRPLTGHRFRMIDEDLEPRLTKADWRLLYEQLKALREYWRRRLAFPPEQRQEVDGGWRNSI